ncbi:MAG: polynucleotide adenylyltransferase PcnB, partial [Candidatus Eremiobacterota bacterium]
MPVRVIPRAEHPISRKNIDDDALKVLYRLYRSGHTAYLVGGSVRDLLLGRRPKDFDVATSARPSQIKRLFRNCRLIGRRFRLAHIHFQTGKIVEVSTFRSDPMVLDEEDRQGLLVLKDNTFGSPEEDARRRDFTVNGLFYDVGDFSLIDYVGGVDDVRKGIIRTIGDPAVRFQEDPVRMIRAIKFAARLNFKIEKNTWKALVDHLEHLESAARPRVHEELARLLESGAAARSLEYLDESGLLRHLEPRLEEYLRRAEAGQVPEDPDGHMVFRMLDEIDNRVTNGWEIERAVLFAVWACPLVLDRGLATAEDPTDLVGSTLDELSERLGLSRRDNERAQQLLMAQRKLLPTRRRRGGLPRGFFQKSYFADSFLLFELWALAAGYASELDWWKQRLESHQTGVPTAGGASPGPHAPA